MLRGCRPARAGGTVPGTGSERLLSPGFPRGCKYGTPAQLGDSCRSTVPSSPVDTPTDQETGSFSCPLK